MLFYKREEGERRGGYLVIVFYLARYFDAGSGGPVKRMSFCALSNILPPSWNHNKTWLFPLKLILIEDSSCKLVSSPLIVSAQVTGRFIKPKATRRLAGRNSAISTAWSQPGSHPRLFQLCNLWRLAPKAADQLIGGSNPEQSYTESSTWNRHWRSRFWSVTGTLVRSVALCNVYPAYRSSATTTIKTVVVLFLRFIKRVSRFFSNSTQN